MLETQFENCPGEGKVLDGDYYIMHAKFSGNPIKEADWEKSVFPGAEIVMSVLVKDVKPQVGYCPRSGCGVRYAWKTNSKMPCSSCGLVIYPVGLSTPLNKSRITEMYDDEEDEEEDLEETRLSFARFSNIDVIGVVEN